jgi:hypothetical protein
MKELIAQAEKHETLAKQGIQPVTNFDAALRLREEHIREVEASLISA